MLDSPLDPRGIVSPLGRLRAFSPATLFANGEPGVWLDPSDTSTLFQDTAGTTPVTTAGQTVARINDKSGNGNHATQATAAARPTYGIVPAGGRRNLLTYTEDFSNSVWKFSNTGTTTIADQASAPDGTTTADELREDTSTGVHRLFGYSTAWTTTTGVAYTFSIHLKAIGRSKLSLSAGGIGVSGPVSFDLTTETAGAGGTITGVGDDWYRCTITGTSPSGGLANPILTFQDDSGAASYTGNGTSGTFIWGAQLELGSTATAYQKVVTQYEVTETGVPSLSYLSFDGVDDFMETPTITPGTDKVQVFAGVRKLSDAAIAVTAEVSGNAGTNDGSFVFATPGSVAANYGFYSGGTDLRGINTPNSYAAPITNILTGLGDISGDRAATRVDGTQAALSSADQGTGNYLAYPHYIGSRAGTSLFFNGRIYSLITRFGPNLDTPNIERTESYVANKTGVTL